nr:PLP-dependent aminotransferase family protein [Kineococcus aurantiacus]
MVSVDRRSPRPVREQVESGLREAVRSGRLSAGEHLPSSRALAEELGVSRGLVQGCYEQLVAEGYLTARAGSATRVAERVVPPNPAPAPRDEPAPAPFVDLRPAVPDLGSFPRSSWSRSAQEALAAAANSALGYPPSNGSPTVRAAVAEHLRRARAADADPSRVVMCTGYAQGLVLTVRSLVARGLRDIAVEDPGHGPDESPDVRTLRLAGARVHRVPVDHLGLDVEALAESPARAVVVTPAHQAPTGVALDPGRRRALIAWARTRDAYVVEDDYDSEFRYDRQAIGTVQGLAPDRVFLLGTTSKTLAPALRIGWLLAPPTWAEVLARHKHLEDRGSPTLHHDTFAVMLTSGRYDRHLRAMRKTYRRRRDAVCDALAAHAPQVRVSGLAAGLSITLHLPPGVDEAAVVAGAAERGVVLRGMDAYRAHPAPDQPQLVLGFGNTDERRLREAIASLADLLQGRSPHRPPSR